MLTHTVVELDLILPGRVVICRIDTLCLSRIRDCFLPIIIFSEYHFLVSFSGSNWTDTE